MQSPRHNSKKKAALILKSRHTGLACFIGEATAELKIPLLLLEEECLGGSDKGAEKGKYNHASCQPRES